MFHPCKMLTLFRNLAVVVSMTPLIIRKDFKMLLAWVTYILHIVHYGTATALQIFISQNEMYDHKTHMSFNRLQRLAGCR